jgi:hypothetical protein
MTHRTFHALVFAVCLCASASAAERVWQKGTWRENVQVKRPKVVFGVAPNSPTTGAPRTSPPAAQEIRTYIIETDTVRFELSERTTADAPHIDVLVGQPVEFAVEKKTVWIKDQDGREHKFSLVKQSKK